MKNIPNRIFVAVDRYDSTTGRWLIGEKNGVREISEEEAFNQLVKAYEDSYTVEDLVRANMEAIKKGWCNNGR